MKNIFQNIIGFLIIAAGTVLVLSLIIWFIVWVWENIVAIGL